MMHGKSNIKSKKFVNLNKSDYLYSMQINAFSERGSVGFTPHSQMGAWHKKKLKNPWWKASCAPFSTLVSDLV
jgi:hypothetical protein